MVHRLYEPSEFFEDDELLAFVKAAIEREPALPNRVGKHWKWTNELYTWASSVTDDPEDWRGIHNALVTARVMGQISLARNAHPIRTNQLRDSRWVAMEHLCDVLDVGAGVVELPRPLPFGVGDGATEGDARIDEVVGDGLAVAAVFLGDRIDTESGTVVRDDPFQERWSHLPKRARPSRMRTNRIL